MQSERRCEEFVELGPDPLRLVLVAVLESPCKERLALADRLHHPLPGLAVAKAKEAEPQAPRKALADTLQDALEAAMVAAIAGELKKPELENKTGRKRS